MIELLKSLKLKRVSINNQITKLSDDIYLNNVKTTSLMREVLIDKFSRIKEIFVQEYNIIIQVRSDDDRYSHDITITNVNPLNTTFEYNPRMQWISGTIKPASTTLINYLNVVAFIATELGKEGEFSNLMKDVFSNVFNKNIEIHGLKSEFTRTTREIESIELRIKFDEFHKNLKVGNFYYKLRGNNLYDIIHIDKFNPKTTAFSHTITLGNNNDIFDSFNDRRVRSTRVKKEELFNHFREFTFFKKEDFKEVVIQNGVEFVRKNVGINAVKDIKVLCNYLKEFNITTEKVPSNDILKYISKWRYNVLEMIR